MGLPQSPAEPPAQSQQSTSQPSTSQTSASQLPPEAIELATKLFDLARRGSTAELQAYLSAGIPANLTNHKGDTLLMLAAYYGHPATCTMLLDQGADVNVLNERGQSPIAGAVFKGYDEVVQVLYEKGGADAEAGHPNAMDSARMFRRAECLRLFGLGQEAEAMGL